jgi:hypothetical protein
VRESKEFDNFSPEAEVVSALRRITGNRGRPFCLMYNPFSRSKYLDNGRERADLFNPKHDKVKDCGSERCLNSVNYFQLPNNNTPFLKRPKIRRTRLE